MNNTNGTHKIKATTSQMNEMLEYYQGYLTYNSSNYIIARAKLPNATITFYRTNVVLFQGLNEVKEYNYWAKKYNLEEDLDSHQFTTDVSTLSAIGSDEVGTGDYFGPVVVCATYVDSSMIEKLRNLGVKDSKLLTDNQMIDNLNFIKAYLHNKVINSILKKIPDVKYDAILIDEFTPKEKYFEYLKSEQNVIKNVSLIKQGEKAHLAVAAASILARVTFLRELGKLSKTYDMEILKGAGPEVDRNAIAFVKAFGWNELSKVAKLKFANTERIKKYFTNNPLPKSKQGNFYDAK